MYNMLDSRFKVWSPDRDSWNLFAEDQSLELLLQDNLCIPRHVI